MVEIESEDAFLDALSARELEIGPLLAFVARLAEQGETARAVPLLELLAETCEARADAEGGLEVLQSLVRYGTELREQDLQERVRRLLGGGSRARRLMAEAGWGQGQPLARTLDKLRLLLSFRPGVVCVDPRWGPGRISSVDVLHGEVVIDFPKEPGHRMSMTSAAERLRIVQPGHMLHELATSPDRLRQQAQRDPAELVKKTLLECGPLSSKQIRQCLVPMAVPEEEWPRFWKAARESLRQDAEVEIPDRSDGLWRISGGRKDRDGLLGRVARSHVEELPDLLRELRKKCGTDRLKKIRSDIEEKVRVYIGDRSVPPMRRLKILMEVQDLLPEGGLHLSDVAEYGRMVRGDNLKECLKMASTRQGRWLIGEIVDLVCEGELSMPPQEILSAAAEWPVMLEAVVQELESAGSGEVVRGFIAESLQSADCSSGLIVWVLKHSEKARVWGISPSAVVRLAVNRLNSGATELAAAMRRELSASLRSPKVVDWLVEHADREELAAVMDLIHSGAVWDEVERRELLGMIIRRRPEMVEVLEVPVERKAVWRVTAWRSYRERQRLLERICSQEIPKAAAEIARAREYGDLRENYEYKAAKEHQALLLRRKEELEQGLSSVRPTDFSYVETGSVAPGVEVEVEFDDGQKKAFTILGVWDQDDALGIISCEAPLARLLLGRRVGDVVVLPDSMGKKVLKITAIRNIGEAARKWIMGDPALDGDTANHL